MIPTSAAELFDRLLPGWLATNKEKAKELGGTYGFRFTGQGGGDWTVDLKSEEPVVSSGLLAEVECIVSMDHQDFLSILQNPSSAMIMFLQGKIKVEGNPMLALKFQKLFTLGNSPTG